MPDISANNELLIKILERLDQLDEKFTGQIQSVRGEVQTVGKRVDQLDEKFTGEIQAVGKRVDQLDEKFTGEIQAVGKRVDRLDDKFTGEIQAVGKRVDRLDDKFTGEIQSVRGEVQAARKEARDFHDSAKETWGHIQRIVENGPQQIAAFIEYGRQVFLAEQRRGVETWDNVRHNVGKNDKRMFNAEEMLSRVVQEIEELKKDMAAKDAILKNDMSAKEAVINDLQQRLRKLETANNLSS